MSSASFFSRGIDDHKLLAVVVDYNHYILNKNWKLYVNIIKTNKNSILKTYSQKSSRLLTTTLERSHEAESAEKAKSSYLRCDVDRTTKASPVHAWFVRWDRIAQGHRCPVAPKGQVNRKGVLLFAARIIFAEAHQYLNSEVCPLLHDMPAKTRD